jgi:hypothetical protein
MMMRIRIGAAFAFLSGATFGLAVVFTESQLARWLFAFSAVVQISWAFVLMLRPGWVYKDL